MKAPPSDYSIDKELLMYLRLLSLPIVCDSVLSTLNLSISAPLPTTVCMGLHPYSNDITKYKFYMTYQSREPNPGDLNPYYFRIESEEERQTVIRTLQHYIRYAVTEESDSLSSERYQQLYTKVYEWSIAFLDTYIPNPKTTYIDYYLINRERSLVLIGWDDQKIYTLSPRELGGDRLIIPVPPYLLAEQVKHAAGKTLQEVVSLAYSKELVEWAAFAINVWNNYLLSAPSLTRSKRS